jgi:hypothetical protein
MRQVGSQREVVEAAMLAKKVRADEASESDLKMDLKMDRRGVRSGDTGETGHDDKKWRDGRTISKKRSVCSPVYPGLCKKRSVCPLVYRLGDAMGTPLAQKGIVIPVTVPAGQQPPAIRVKVIGVGQQ